VSPAHVQQVVLSAGLLLFVCGSYMRCLLAGFVSFCLLVLGVTTVDACLARASVFLRGEEPGYTQRWIAAVFTVQLLQPVVYFWMNLSNNFCVYAC
jgi:hypothetical protein